MTVDLEKKQEKSTTSTEKDFLSFGILSKDKFDNPISIVQWTIDIALTLKMLENNPKMHLAEHHYVVVINSVGLHHAVSAKLYVVTACPRSFSVFLL